MEDKEKEKKEEFERDKLLFELISDTYNSESARFNIIDDKASKIVVFVGLLIGLLSSFGTLLIKDVSTANPFYYPYLACFITSVIFLISSVLCGLYAYWIRKFAVVPNVSTMIEYGKENKDQQDILRIISMERSKAVGENEENLKTKIIAIKIGYVLLVIGIIISIIFVFFILTTNTINMSK